MVSSSMPNKLNFALKYETEAVLRLSSIIIRNINDETNFPHKLLLTSTQVANLHEASTNNSPVNIKLSKTQLSKIRKLGGFLCRLLCPLLKSGWWLIKIVV